MTALPKTVPYLYALGREEDSRREFAEDAGRILELSPSCRTETGSRCSKFLRPSCAAGRERAMKPRSR